MTLSQAQRAAAVVLAIGKDRAGRLIGQFKRDELKTLVEAARGLRAVDPPDLQRLAADFEKEFRVGAGLVDSGAMMDVILGQSLTPDEVDNLTRGNQANAAPPGDRPDIWTTLGAVDPDTLGAFLAEQAPVAAAFIMSRLLPDQAVAVTAGIDASLRHALFGRILSLPAVPAVTVSVVETALAAAFPPGENASRGADASVARIADILNALPRDEADHALAGMAATVDARKLAAIRARLFRFDDIAGLDQPARALVFDGMASEKIIAALAAATPEIREAVLSAISQRMRRLAESELATARVPPDQTRAAQKDIVATIMKLASEGRFALPGATTP